MLWRTEPLAQEIMELYLLQGTAQPFHSWPITLAEAQKALSRIEPGRLPEAGLKILRLAQSRLRDQVIYQEDQVEVTQDLRLNLKAHEGSVAPTDRVPFLDLNLAMSVTDSLYAVTNFGYRKDILAEFNQDEGIQTNLFTDLTELDFSFPYNSGVSYGGALWNLQWAQGVLDWGPGRTGNLALSSAAYQHDYLKFTTFWDGFKFTSVIVSQDNYPYKTYDHDGDSGVSTPEIAKLSSFGFYRTDEDDGGDDPGFTTGKWITSHRLEARLPLEFNVAVVETQIVESKVFDLRWLMPFKVYHNWFLSTNANNDMALEIGWSGLPGFRAYGVFYADYISTDFKEKMQPDENPPTFAYQAGFEHRLPLGPGILENAFEWVFLDPFVYINQHVNMTITRRYLSTFGGGGRFLIESPLGYYLGPDTIVYDYQGGYQIPALFRTQWGVSHIQKGEQSIYTPHPLDENSIYQVPQTGTYSNQTPTGTPQYTTTLSWTAELVGEGWGLPAGLLLGGGVSWSYIVNTAHVSGAETSQFNWFVELAWDISRFFTYDHNKENP